MKALLLSLSALIVLFACVQQPGGQMSVISDSKIQSTIEQCVEKHGSTQSARIEKGVSQVAALWQNSDGSPEDFTKFCIDNFVSDSDNLDQTAERFEKLFESIDGHFLEIIRDLRQQMDLDLGPMLPVDYQFAEYSPWTHLSEDLFKTGVAFSALLNFPLYTLEERIKLGPDWSRDDWARARLVERFGERVPSEVSQELTTAYVRADDYIANYNIHMHNVLTEDEKRLFPEGLKLITHWGLRDELKGRYADPQGLEKQEMILLIMQQIVLQQIPEVVIDNPGVDWKPSDNSVQVTTLDNVKKHSGNLTDSREPDTRYQHFLNTFLAERKADPYYPTMPTKIDRRFQSDREIPEEKVEELFVSLLTSDAFKNTGKLIEKRLGRSLRPFDIWYNGFKARGNVQESDLDKIVKKRYPTIQAFEKDIPRILRKLGFDRETARFLGTKIKVDPARGAGHAMGAARRADNAHLRTRVPKEGMNYKGYNIAIHELGHNVEQVLSLNKIDHTLLNGVPNTAFTEAFAFVFQARDLELLGQTADDADAEPMKALAQLWSTCEIAGVSLVDMKVWRWMYENPEATAADLKAALLRISKEVWNTYFAPVFGVEDSIILGIYSHMISIGMYLPDYPLGHIIAFQIESYLKGKNLGKEMERMCVLGRITPDAWMEAAVGEAISTEPMILAANEALKILK